LACQYESVVVRIAERSGMDDRETQHLLKRIKIAVVVKQSVPVLQTKRGDQAIDRSPDRIAVSSQPAIMFGCRNCQGHAASCKHFEFQQFLAYSLEKRFLSDPLEDFTEDEVRDAQTLALQLRLEPVCLSGTRPSQIVHPDRCIHDDHDAC